MAQTFYHVLGNLYNVSLCYKYSYGAHLVSNSYKYNYITHILKDLHWLPVQQRINFKILLFPFKCPGQVPKYLQDVLTWSQPKGLRSDNKLLLVLPKSNLW